MADQENRQAGQGHEHHDRDVLMNRLGIDGNTRRCRQAGDPEHAHQIEEVAPDHVADGDVPLALEGRDERRGHLRQ